jgi:hypothetical protein
VRGGRRLGTPVVDPIVARLAEIALYKHGWLNGQGEEIAGPTLLTARRLATALPEQLHPLLICATEPGGIEIEWRDQHGAHSIEVQPDGTLLLLGAEDKASQSAAAGAAPVRAVP